MLCLSVKYTFGATTSYYTKSAKGVKTSRMNSVSIIVVSACLLHPVFLRPSAPGLACDAPELVCRAAANQDRSLYVRDRCRYEQRIRIERFKLKNGEEKMEEVRKTAAMVEPAEEADKTGRTPVVVRVTEDSDKNGKPKDKVDQDAKTFLSFGAILDLAFFPLLPEKIGDYTFQEVIAERKNEKWYRFFPKPYVLDRPLASGIVQLEPATGEVLTVKIEGLHNLESVDKNARKLRSFNATIDYSQFDGTLRMPTLASGGGVSEIPRFEGSFRFKFEEGRYLIVRRID